MSANIDITHSFSHAQANQYGVHGAILLRYFINHIRSSTNIWACFKKTDTEVVWHIVSSFGVQSQPGTGN